MSGEGETNLIPTRIFTTEPMGDTTILDIEIGDDLVKVVVSPDFVGEAGMDIWLSFPPDKVYLFDRQSGQTLT